MCDLIPFLFGSRYQLNARKKDLEIIAGPGFQDFFDKLMLAFKHWLRPTKNKMKIIEIAEGTKEYETMKVKIGKVKHIGISNESAWGTNQ